MGVAVDDGRVELVALRVELKGDGSFGFGV